MKYEWSPGCHNSLTRVDHRLRFSRIFPCAFNLTHPSWCICDNSLECVAVYLYEPFGVVEYPNIIPSFFNSVIFRMLPVIVYNPAKSLLQWYSAKNWKANLPCWYLFKITTTTTMHFHNQVYKHADNDAPSTLCVVLSLVIRARQNENVFIQFTAHHGPEDS